jgi:hypothetical protein
LAGLDGQAVQGTDADQGFAGGQAQALGAAEADAQAGEAAWAQAHGNGIQLRPGDFALLHDPGYRIQQAPGVGTA